MVCLPHFGVAGKLESLCIKMLLDPDSFWRIEGLFVFLFVFICDFVFQPYLIHSVLGKKPRIFLINRILTRLDQI